MTPAQRPTPSSLYLHTIASEAKIESTEPKKLYAKQLEQPSKGGMGYQGL